MNIVLIVLAVILFFVLSPGILLRLPQKGSLLTVAAVHAVVFSVLLWGLSTFVLNANVKLEGFNTVTTTPPRSTKDSDALKLKWNIEFLVGFPGGTAVDSNDPNVIYARKNVLSLLNDQIMPVVKYYTESQIYGNTGWIVVPTSVNLPGNSNSGSYNLKVPTADVFNIHKKYIDNTMKYPKVYSSTNMADLTADLYNDLNSRISKLEGK